MRIPADLLSRPEILTIPRAERPTAVGALVMIASYAHRVKLDLIPAAIIDEDMAIPDAITGRLVGLGLLSYDEELEGYSLTDVVPFKR